MKHTGQYDRTDRYEWLEETGNIVPFVGASRDFELAGSNGSMLFKTDGWTCKIHGGPYMSRPNSMFGIKLDDRSRKACDVDLPIRDFSVPEAGKLRFALMRALIQLRLGNQVYVGCLGGFGRTGLFMASLAKVMFAINGTEYLGYGAEVADPVRYVRTIYTRRAVETADQEQFVEDLQVDDLARWARML